MAPAIGAVLGALLYKHVLAETLPEVASDLHLPSPLTQQQNAADIYKQNVHFNNKEGLEKINSTEEKGFDNKGADIDTKI